VRTRGAESVLDNPVWHALTGTQGGLGTVTARAGRFDPDVAPFGAFAAEPTDGDWHEIARLSGSVNRVAIVGGVGTLPPDLDATWRIGAAQMLLEEAERIEGSHEEAEGAEEVVPLGPGDADEMLELVALARPGPFLPRTVEFGGYLGIRWNGVLIAMAGERLRPPGFAEISAVATHPDHRKHGHGRRLVHSVADAIVQRGDRPFLHVAHENEAAMRLYRSMGFTTRRDMEFTVVEGPAATVGERAQPE
jgi:GNAT superfamily N-acetyltransferase